MLSVSQPTGKELIFPLAEPPQCGEPLEVAPGIMWLRLPLPFRLDHVNVWLLDDGDGWAIIDTGIASDACRQIWERLLAGQLAGKRITRVIVTHYHPDHIGLAGWLCERTGAPLLIGQMDYLASSNISLGPGALDNSVYHDFYLRNGASRETADIVSTSGHGYLRMVSPLPHSFVRLTAGERLTIGSRTFEIMTGEGHSPEQLMFHCPEDSIFLSADQVIEKITPNISVWAVEPDGDPLGLYLQSLERLIHDVSDVALVLPGHRRPFHGLHLRCRQIAEHHAERCDLIRETVRQGSYTVSELVPVLFHRPLDPHQLSFAFSETLAHVNYMIRLGELHWIDAGDVRKMAIG
ncbi:MAG: MBL fold metallo-hydrolase [Nitratireductor sp.]|nr:MBL fold metallo-hydrolase [Nitratireductor sp.]